MREGKLQIYCGSGKGKTTAALGQAIKEASLGRSVFVVQFMKCRKADEEISFIQRLEPEIKLFRFQRREAAFEDLAPEEQQEEIMNMKNGLNFAKKVLATGECDVLILDEPTRGIDVGAKNEIYKLMNRLAAEGKSIIMISSEMTEVLRMSDRIIVMCEGKITGNIDISEATQEHIMNHATRNIN